MSTNKSSIEKITLGSFLIALGVVYGDIGTSPLYVMKSIINGNGGLERWFLWKRARGKVQGSCGKNVVQSEQR